MLSTCLRPNRAWVLLGAFLLATPVAGAQDEFDDEFGDEFGDTPSGEGRGRPGTGGTTEPETFDEEFGDEEFGDEEIGDDELADDDTFDDEFADGGAAERSAETPADSPFGDPDDDGVTAAPAASVPGVVPAEVREERARQMRVHNTLGGAVGGFRVADAGGGAAGSFRLQLALEYFTGGDYMYEVDQNQRVGGYLSLSWTPEEFLELYVSTYAGANSNDQEDPALVQVIGDTTLGVKAFARVLPWLTLGGDFSVLFLNTVGDIGVVFDSTSFGIRGNATADLRYLEDEIPFIARLGLQYFFDRSERLITDVEQARYDAIVDPPPAVPYANENRNLITRIERFALDINRTDFFDVQLGFEVPIALTDTWFLHPILEWDLRIPVNRQDYNCLDLRDEVTGDLPPGEDGCLDIVGFAAFPQILTLGVRVLPPLAGLSFLLGIDIGLTGTNDPVRELAATTPWNLLFGASWAFDATPIPPDPIVQVVERELEVPVEPPGGRVLGVVVERGAGSPIEGAVVNFTGRDVTALSTSADGSFRSYEFEPGEVAMAVTHPDYEPGTCAAVLPPEGGDGEARCELTARPRATAIRVRVVGAEGRPVSGARIDLTGPTTKSATTGADGSVEIGDLSPGNYRAQVDAENYLIRVVPSIDVRAGSTTQLEVTLLEKPAEASVVVRPNAVVLRRRINFATDSAEILPSSEGLLNEIADVLLRSPQIKRVEIQGHTDNRARNRRVQFIIRERAE